MDIRSSLLGLARRAGNFVLAYLDREDHEPEYIRLSRQQSESGVYRILSVNDWKVIEDGPRWLVSFSFSVQPQFPELYFHPGEEWDYLETPYGTRLWNAQVTGVQTTSDSQLVVFQGTGATYDKTMEEDPGSA